MVDGDDEVIPSLASNYYQGNWIAHPAQISLHQVPEPLRTKCLDSFLASRQDARPVRNYQDWLDVSFGEVFAATFPAAYTRKYWTVDPSMLSTEWVGNRVMKPSVEQVQAGAVGPVGIQGPHYLHGKESRYPRRGGFMAYTHKMARAADIRLNTRVTQVNFAAKSLRLSDGSVVTYDHLVSTIPLKALIPESVDAPEIVREAAGDPHLHAVPEGGRCRQPPAAALRGLDVRVRRGQAVSVRISTTEHFSELNAPTAVRGSRWRYTDPEYRACPTDQEWVKRTVVDELLEMGLIEGPEHVRSVSCTASFRRAIRSSTTAVARAIKEIRGFLATPCRPAGRAATASTST